MDNIKKSKPIPEGDTVPVPTSFDRRIYIGIAQYKHDLGLPFDQDVIRLLVAVGLEKAGYPKEVHKIK